MSLTTTNPKTASQLLARLTETECIQIRAASPERLEHLRTTSFASDGPVTAEALAEVKATLDAEYAAFDTLPKWWQKQTWKL